MSDVPPRYDREARPKRIDAPIEVESEARSICPGGSVRVVSAVAPASELFVASERLSDHDGVALTIRI